MLVSAQTGFETPVIVVKELYLTEERNNMELQSDLTGARQIFRVAAMRKNNKSVIFMKSGFTFMSVNSVNADNPVLRRKLCHAA